MGIAEFIVQTSSFFHAQTHLSFHIIEELSPNVSMSHFPLDVYSRHLEMVILFCQIALPHPWYIDLSRFKLLFESHGATHPTREQREPCSAGLVEEEKTPAGPQSAAQALDGVGLA